MRSTASGAVRNCVVLRVGHRLLERFRKTEVEHFDDAIRPQLDVGRLEIAMDDALLVRGFERERYLHGNADGLAGRQRDV